VALVRRARIAPLPPRRPTSALMDKEAALFQRKRTRVVTLSDNLPSRHKPIFSCGHTDTHSPLSLRNESRRGEPRLPAGVPESEREESPNQEPSYQEKPTVAFDLPPTRSPSQRISKLCSIQTVLGEIRSGFDQRGRTLLTLHLAVYVILR
jgi:hypothetical protein